MERTVVYAGTRNIYHDMLVSAKSVLYNNGADKIVFLIEDDTFPEELPPCITTRNVSGQTIFPHNGPNYKSMWTYMVMMRMALTKLFPDLERIVTLDHDTIVHKPIDLLWTIDLSGYYFAAVEETQIRNRNHPYFNFGVLVHNLSALRDGTDDAIIHSINTTRHTYCEQDAGNSICHHRILDLPLPYNALPFNNPSVPDDRVIIRHHAARKEPLNQFPDYQFFDRMTWDKVLSREGVNGTEPIELKRYDIINHFIRERNYHSFLEIGTASGETFRNVSAPVRVSVDPDQNTDATFHMTSDDFFRMNKERYDIIFIDGLHTHSQAYRDIRNALSALNENGVIIVHDCLPTSEHMQQPATRYPGGLWTGDVWKAFVRIRSELSVLSYTVDADFGCGVIDTSREREGDTSELPTDMERMTYSDFVSNKQEWMNIRKGYDYDR